MSRRRYRTAAALMACTIGAAFLLVVGDTAGAAIVATVQLATSANYAVLGASTVTNTGNSVLDNSLGLWPGTSITGFPPGQVLPPATTDTTNAAAQQGQSDLTTAYVNAAGRPLNATTTADLANLVLQGGVYAGPSKGALGLTGPLVLDGAGDLSSVFIFQTDSTLITATGSTVTLINGAQECNVFWQVGSSATLGTSSVFVGNVLALTSITVANSVTVHGRALARNGAVTLDNDAFTKPTCVQPAPATTTTTQPATTTTAAPAITTTTQPATTTTTRPATTTTTQPATTTTQPATTTTQPATTTTTRPATTTTTQPATTTTRPATTANTQPATTTTRPATTANTQPATTTTRPATTAVTVASTSLSGPIGVTPTTAASTSMSGVVGVTTATAASTRMSGVVGVTTATAASTSPSAIVLSAVSNNDAAAELAMPLPRTGAPIGSTLLLAAFFLTLGGLAIRFGRSKTAPRR